MTPLATILAASLHSLALAALQDAPGPRATPVQGPPALQPGVLPADTGARESALWKGMLAAMGETASRAAVSAFDLDFDGTLYSGEKQANDFDARYQYLKPAFVRMILKSGRQRLRGPRGDFVIEKGVAYALAGREFAEDRRELEETLTVSRTFVGLSDPSALRVERLLARSDPPPGLPSTLGAEAADLEWLSVWSPDFRSRADARAAARDRIDLGLERASHRPRLALLTDESDPRASFLVRLENFRDVDGFQVPHHVTTWRVEPQGPGQGLAEKPALELWLEKGSLRPRLGPEDFLPPG